MPMKTVRTVEAVRQHSRNTKQTGLKVGLVPTMGGLHEGHLSLVRKARELSDIVIVSLFVNPKQFNNPDDLETYPGDEKTDIAALEEIGVDVVFIPSVEEMYPEAFSTQVIVSAAGNILCDAHRPGHFEGVATVVAKLFLQVEPDFACFGEKDFQQLFIIRSLVRDLNIPVEIIPVETVRESDGLAMSSRNARLSKRERQIAAQLQAKMKEVADKIKSGSNPSDVSKDARTTLEADGNFSVEYLEYRSGETLKLLDHHDPAGRLFAAAWLGDVRLIDNLAV
ncbi:MAG: pantoate--beta-alanine ligase [Pseudomonadota bacterium]